MANKLAALLDAKEAARPQGQPYGLSTAVAAPELPERAGALPQRLQDIALAYISARQRAGDSLLEMARWMSEARAVAIRGEWYVFLEATNTSANHAESLLAIHARAMNDPVFAAAMRRNFLSLSAGYELLSAPAEVQDRLLQSEQPITRKQIREEKEATKPHAGVGYGTAQAPLPAMPPVTTAAERETDLPAEYDIIKRRLAAHSITLLSNMQGHHRAYVTRKEGMTGVVTFDWADVLSKLERLEVAPDPDPSAAAFRMTCPTCGETILNGVWGDLNECGACYHARQRIAAAQPDPAHVRAIEEQIEAGDREPQLMPTLADLDAAGLSKDLSDAGYYWHSATPPTIALNGSAWRGDAPTVEGAIESARLHKDAKATPIATTLSLNPMEYKALSREAAIFLKAGGDRRFPTTWKVLTLVAARAFEATE